MMRKKTIQVILTEDVQKLGKQGTLIKVKPGYLRNYLIPLKLGKIATTTLIEQFESQQKKLELEKLQFNKKCSELKNLIESFGKLTIKKKVSESGVFYGKITKRQILDLLINKIDSTNIINKNQIQLPEIKQLGDYIVDINITANITAKISLEILPE